MAMNDQLNGESPAIIKTTRKRGGPPPAGAMPQFPGGLVAADSVSDPEYPLPPDPQKLDPSLLFERIAPVVVELGSGKGRFIIDAAMRRTDSNFIAVEWVNKYYKMIVSRAAHRGLKNVRVVRDDARHFITDALCDRSISECHIYHPDPWPKKRHHKRRLVRPGFLSALHRVLAPDGRLVFQTDHQDLWSYSVKAIERYFKVSVLDGLWPDSPLGRTNYEIKAIQAGWPVFRLTATPLPNPPDSDETESLERSLEQVDEG
jgi:tRNA (guanine-N7-)-methyltransferase